MADCMIEPPEIFTRIYARHGHRCPMSTLGGRLGLAAMHFLGDIPGVRHAVYSHRTCALDGIAEATGCNEATGSLVVVNTGRHALALTTGEASVEVELTAAALGMAGCYRSLCNHLESGWEELTPDEQVRRCAEMEAMLDELLPQFWQAEDGLLVQKVSG